MRQLPAHVGRQIGSNLLNAAEVAARNRGFTGVRLEVSERNSAARNLYHRGGYVVVGRLHAYYADGDALRLQKLFI